MDIIIISQYLGNIEKMATNNGRFVYLAKLLGGDKNNKIEIITSQFIHSKKRHAKMVDKCDEFKITALQEPGYAQNVCLSRLYSHRVLAKNVKEYLRKREKPDVVYVAVPSLDVAEVVARYCKKNNIRFIVDIQDLWPEAFKMVLNIPLISNLIFEPMRWKADRIYRAADEIIAVSDTYVKRGLQKNSKSIVGQSVFLGTEKDMFDCYRSEVKHSDRADEVWLVYIGTLGHSYDLTIVFEALKILKEKGISNIKFLVMGEGPLRKRFEEYAEKLGIEVQFTGRLEYPEMVRKLTECDVAINPIMHGAAQSIINKVGDYAMAGLPVISTQECLEYRELLQRYEAGISCDNSNVEQLADTILMLAKNKDKRLIYGENSRRLGEERFDRKHTYQKILKCIIK